METTTTLTAMEMRLSGELGLTRGITSMLKNHKDNRISQYKWDSDIVGAMGELALAKILGKTLEPSIDTFKLPDLESIQIRTTTWATGKLIIRSGDPFGIYVLVIAEKNVFRAAGWTDYRGTFNDQYYVMLGNKPPKCWALPQAYLSSISTL